MKVRRTAWLVAPPAIVAVIATVVLATPLAGRASVADGVLPARLHQPWAWQADVEQAPAGQASVLFSGGGGLFAGGLGCDDGDVESRQSVLSRTGAYRVMRTAPGECHAIQAGQEARLSPDGRRVAFNDYEGVVVADLGTGKKTRVAKGYPLAWSRDGGAVMVGGFGLTLIDLATGDTRPFVLDLGWGRWGNRAAFSSNGGLVALQGEQTAVVTADSTTLWTQDLGDREVLAAFTPDGTRIVTARAQGCVVACSRADASERRWTFGYRDARSGAPAAGPTMPSLTAADVRVLGWSQGLDLVMVRYDAPARDWSTQAKLSDRYSRAHGHAAVVALHPDGTVTSVLDTPPDVTGVEVALNLIEAGRFGGPPPTPSPFAADAVMAGIYIGPWIVVIAVATVLIVRSVRRRLVFQRLRAGYSP